MQNEQTALRAEWLDLMRRRLPQAARERPDWPIRLDHCFGRVILDAVYGRPWREAIGAPAWRSMGEAELRAAIALGEAILRDEADLHALDASSLDLRGKPQKVRQTATTGPRSSGTLRPA
jgi:hypothetical protein